MNEKLETLPALVVPEEWRLFLSLREALSQRWDFARPSLEERAREASILRELKDLVEAGHWYQLDDLMGIQLSRLVKYTNGQSDIPGGKVLAPLQEALVRYALGKALDARVTDSYAGRWPGLAERLAGAEQVLGSNYSVDTCKRLLRAYPC